MVAVDGSESAKRTFRFAVNLMNKDTDTFLIVNVCVQGLGMCSSG